MAFDPTFQYGAGVTTLQKQSAPPLGRKVVGADFVAMYIGNIAVGLVQRFSPREAREVMPQYEIGDIYPVEYVPSTWTGNIEIARLEVFKDSLFDALGFNNALSQDTYDLASYWPSDKTGPIQGGSANAGGGGINGPIVTNLVDIQWPIDIAMHTTNPGPDQNGVTIKTYKECWITGYGSSFDAGAKVVMETCTFTFRETMISVVSQAKPSAGSNSLYQLPV